MLHTIALAAALLAAAPKPANFDSPSYPSLADYTRILERFPRYAERGWHDLPGQPGVGWFGDGHSAEQGQRTLANFILAYAWLATNPNYDAAVSGVSQQTVLDHCLAAIRFRLRTHVTGDLLCADKKKWGDHWQSSWWVSRMLAGLELVRDKLSAAELKQLEAVVVHEADRHVGLKPRVNEYGDTKAEENAWDTEVMAWALNLYPQHPHAAGWQQGFNQLCLNTLSVADDANNNQLIDGKPISQWVGGPCVHPDYTIENHGPFHICYMACPLHSLSWSWYAYASHGRSAPQVVYHHYKDVWNRLKQFALWRGWFAYVGGQDWPRYAYGMYFILPALVHNQIALNDPDARLLERQRVGMFEREQLVWDDGSFFSGRFAKGTMAGWPSEWETDCAANLTIAALMHRLGASPHPTSPEVLATKNIGTFISPYSEFAMRRDPQRLASLCWRSNRGPVTALVCSDRGETMLEFDHNLSGTLTFGAGVKAGTTVLGHSEQELTNGFASGGTLGHGTAAATQASTWRVKVQDDALPVTTIAAPDHPLFNTPNKLTSLAGLRDLDSVAEAAPAWVPLAKNSQGQPSLMEATIGRGKFLVSMTNAEQLCVEGDPTARKLLENVLAYTGAKTKRCGYIAGEAWLKQALETLKQPVEAVGGAPVPAKGKRPAIKRGPGPDFSPYGVLFIDRSSPAAVPLYPRILEWVRGGGIVFESILQHKFWEPDNIGERAAHAVTQSLACVAVPDGRTTVLVGRFVANAAVPVASLDLLEWRLGNDVHNGFRRVLESADPTKPKLDLLGMEGKEAVKTTLKTSWLTVDGDLSAVLLSPGASVVVDDQPKRNASSGSQCFGVVRLVPDGLPRKAAAGEELGRHAVILRTRCGAAEAQALAEAAKVEWTGGQAVVTLPGADKASYTITVAADGAASVTGR